MNLRRAATTSLAVVVAWTPGMGSAATPQNAAGAGHHHAAQPWRSIPGTAAAGAGDVVFLTGYPHEAYTDERMIEEELELAEAAPHTRWRCDAGSA